MDRFLAKTEILSGPGACWEWRGCRDKDGYGRLWDGALGADMVAKSRHIKGEDAPKAKLQPSQVAEIRALAAQGESHRSLAKRYGVAPQAIAAIHRRQSWRHLPEIANG